MTKQTDYHARHGQKKLTIWLTPDERALLEVAARAAGTSKKQAVVKGLWLLMSEQDGGTGLQMSDITQQDIDDAVRAAYGLAP